MRRLARLFVPLVLCAACLPVPGALAASYNVSSNENSGAGSLRAAIEASNDPTAEDAITITATGAIELDDPLPPITDDVTITGPGASSLTVARKEGAPFFSVFDFVSGTTSSLTGLTISDGVAEAGAGISNEGNLTLTKVVVTGNEARNEGGGAFSLAVGGGISSSGPLTIRESTIRNNSAAAEDGSTATIAVGGGIQTDGKLTMERSTISENVVSAVGESSDEAFALGGGIRTGAPANIQESTISGNSLLAVNGATTSSQGGGIFGDGLTLTGSTVTRNSIEGEGTAFGANLYLQGASLVRNTIVSKPEGNVGVKSCNTALPSGGYNLDEDGSCEFGQGSDLRGDPLLGPLADNGGPTPTHALLSGSVAIDRGNSFGATTDQRGLPRPSDFPAISNKEGGDGSDIGAFELQAPPAPFGGGAAPIQVQVLAGDRQPPNTRIVSGPARAGFKRLAKFRFASTEPQSRFQCKVDKAPWRGCRNPFKRKVSAAGGNGRKHVFKVRAIDRFGNVDPTPARFSWRVKKLGG